MTHDTEAEQVLLGMLMFDNLDFYKASELEPDDFYFGFHGRLYAEIRRRVHHGDAANPVTLKAVFDGDEELREVGGGSYLVRLVGRASGGMAVKPIAKQISELSKRRKMVQLLHDTEARLLNPEEQLEDILTDHGASCLSLAGSDANHALPSNMDVSLSVCEALEANYPSFPTGLPLLDSRTLGGLHSRRSYCIAARPKNGKTMMLGTIAHNMAENGARVLYIAAEMGANEIQQRNLARKLGRNSVAFLTDRSDKNFRAAVLRQAQKEAKTAFYLDLPGITFNQLKHHVVSAKHLKKIDGFVLDYLQLVKGKPKGQSDAEFHAEVAQWVAEICKKENLFALYAAQINREGNIRGSDGIIMAADQVYHLQMNEERDTAWMEMVVTRYTPHKDLGAECEPAFLLNKHGPHFQDLGVAA